MIQAVDQQPDLDTMVGDLLAALLNGRRGRKALAGRRRLDVPERTNDATGKNDEYFELTAQR